MANPIIKIKTGSSKPEDYTLTTISGNTTQKGLTAGELGAVVTPPDYAFYIGNNSGKAITFGNEISTDNSLGSSNPSDFKIPTQKAVKEFIDNNCFSSGSQIESASYYVSSDKQIASLADEQKLLFGGLEYSTIPSSILSVSTNSDTFSSFTNTSFQDTYYFLVCYQITWDWFASTQTYNSAGIIRSAWIQKAGPINYPPTEFLNVAENVYGFSTLLCPPLQNTSLGAITGTQTASAVIELKPLQGFTINVRNHSGSLTNVLSQGRINNGFPGSPQQINFERATRLQIVKL